MNLRDALSLLAAKLHLDPAALIDFAADDHEGGRNQGFSGWSIDPDEGKLLYALVRALKPNLVIEVGTHQGASAAHLLAALQAIGEGGELHSFDYQDVRVDPALYAEDWRFHQISVMDAELPRADFVFEDSDHSLAGATAILMKLKLLAPRLIIVHDYAMTTEHGDFHVKEAFETVLPEGFGLTLDGCERGLGVWINPTWTPPAPKVPEPNGNVDLTKAEVEALVSGETLEIKANGDATLQPPETPELKGSDDQSKPPPTPKAKPSTKKKPQP